MVDSYTDNRNLVLPLVGGDSGTWGGILNAGVMTYLDGVLGNTQAISISSVDVTLTIDQWNNAAINLTGTLTGNKSLILPLNVNSATVAVGGLFVVANNTTGAYTVTVKTAASGSTGVVIPQGVRSFLYSDTTNVWFADDSRLSLQTYAGNPNGNVAGTAASSNNPPSVVWDYTNFILWVCTTTGTTSTAVWTNTSSSSLTLATPQGYLTPVSNTPVITSDSIAATVVYYTPFLGSYAAIHNGTGIVPYQFSQMQLTLSSSQAANNIYDVFLAYNGGTPVIGTGPSWASGTGGSVTAGSCVRGTGTGGAAISRASPSGLWVNTAVMSLIYNPGSGNNTISVSAGQGIYLGSLYMDSIAGQITCHRSYGQARKWGISNAYNRVNVILQEGDSTANWTFAGGFRPSHNDTANNIVVFQGLAEEEVSFSFEQKISITGTTTPLEAALGVGINSTSSASGTVGTMGGVVGSGASGFGSTQTPQAKYDAAPFLGINVATPLESAFSSATTFYGTQSYMLFRAAWRA